MRTHFAVFFYFLDVLYRSEMCENNCDKRQQKFRSSTFRFVSLTPLTVVVAADDDDEMTSLQVSMPTWKLGEAVCKLVPMVAGTNVFVSTLSITAIALDRFHLIVHPTDKDHLCRNNVKKIIFSLARFAFCNATFSASFITIFCFLIQKLLKLYNYSCISASRPTDKDHLLVKSRMALAVACIWLLALLLACPLLVFSITRAVEPVTGFRLYEVCVENPDLHVAKAVYFCPSSFCTATTASELHEISTSHARISNVLLCSLLVVSFCWEFCGFHVAKAVYSVVSALLQYLAPIVIVSVAHAQICNKLRSRMHSSSQTPPPSSRLSVPGPIPETPTATVRIVIDPATSASNKLRVYIHQITAFINNNGLLTF